MFHRALRIAQPRLFPRWTRSPSFIRLLSIRAADYTIACICPMGVELAPVEAILDKIHKPASIGKNRNAYTLGQVGEHHVVIAVMPEIGNNAAATVATQLLNDFPQVRFGLLVGIGGGVPGEADIRLGDVVVSQPNETFGGVVQYDLGKKTAGGTFQRTGMLNKPPAFLTAHVRKLQAKHLRSGHELVPIMADMIKRYPAMQDKYGFPEGEMDQLFLSDDASQVMERPPRPDTTPVIHYGTVGSANVVVKDAEVRDQLRQDMKILCVEMEAAGLMTDFPCLVIRGICDYADSHKHKRWQPYAAAVAAAYTKELLMEIPAQLVESKVSSFGKGSHLANAPVIDQSLFVGRQFELESMYDALKPGEGRRELVLGGIGGIGKTQLSLAYAQCHAKEYDSIFWLDASSEMAMKSSLSTVAQVVEEPTVERAVQWFSQPGNSQWLIVCDNYDNPEDFKIRKYLPTASHGALLVTTRVPDQVGDRQIAVSPLRTIEESLQVLETRSGRRDLQFDNHAVRLAERLQGLPLALATAGTYLRKSTWSFEQYLHEYESRWNINPRKPLQLREYQDRTLYTTWDLSYKRLEKEDPDIASFLKLLAYFDSQQLWFGLFQFCAEATSDFPPHLQRISQDSGLFDNAMWVLADYGFVERQPYWYSMHPCVHDWTVGSLNSEVDQSFCQFVFNGVASWILKVDPSTMDHLQFGSLGQQYTRLTHRLYDTMWAQLPVDHLDHGHALAIFLQRQAHPVPAAIAFEKVASRKQHLLGPSDPSTLLTLAMLAQLYFSRGRREAANYLYQQVVSHRTQLLEWQEPRSGDALIALSILGFHFGDHEISSTILHKLMTHLTTERSRTILEAIGIVAELSTNLADAEELLVQCCEQSEELFGFDNAQTLLFKGLLGGVYRKRKKYRLSEEILLRAQETCYASLGETHYLTRCVNHYLAQLYFTLGYIQSAVHYQSLALVNLQQISLEEDINLLILATQACDMYLMHNLIELAADLAPRIVAPTKQIYGDQSENHLYSICHLGRLHFQQARYVEAESTFDFAISFGKSEPRTWEVKLRQAQVYHAQGRSEESDQLIDQVKTECLAALPVGDDDRVIFLHDVAFVYRYRNDEQKAGEHYLQAFQEWDSGQQNERTSYVVRPLFEYYQRSKRMEEADQLAAKHPTLVRLPDYNTLLDQVSNEEIVPPIKPVDI